MTRRPRGPPSAGPPKPPQLDQKMSDSNAPNAPTARRIQPIVWISMPLTVALTAQTSTAPAATSRRLTPIPMFRFSFRLREQRTLRVCRENVEWRFPDTPLGSGAVHQPDQRHPVDPVHYIHRSRALVDAEDGLVRDREPDRERSADRPYMGHHRDRLVGMR